MENAPEQGEKRRHLERTYRQLLKVSQDQRALIDNMAGNERFTEQFQSLSMTWTSLQAEISATEHLLRSSLGEEAYGRFFSSDIAPIIQSIQRHVGETMEQMTETMKKTGVSIRDANERRLARQAYTEMDHESLPAMFFDEKK